VSLLFFRAKPPTDVVAPRRKQGAETDRRIFSFKKRRYDGEGQVITFYDSRGPRAEDLNWGSQNVEMHGVQSSAGGDGAKAGRKETGSR
jgi:hypothetical protein